MDLLAAIIYCEAGGESYEGQVAVGSVVLNRMDSSLYPDELSDVIYQSGQFEPAFTGRLAEVLASGAPDYCYDSAQAALDGENPVGDCLYFHAGGGGTITIGNQTFY
ncbi:MAG: cell wall hydrolase [Eubacterium sp.]|nr:cell wall hydrolase [Eubacterium sp.]